MGQKEERWRDSSEAKLNKDGARTTAANIRVVFIFVVGTEVGVGRNFVHRNARRALQPRKSKISKLKHVLLER